MKTLHIISLLFLVSLLTLPRGAFAAEYKW